jgi:hemolysin activation/secretion protein
MVALKMSRERAKPAGWGVLFLACAFAAFAVPASGQTPGQTNSETQRRQEQLEQAQPSPETGPQQDLVIGPEYSNPDMPPPGAGPQFALMAVQIDSSQFLGRAEIDPILQQYVGKEVNFADLSAIVGRLNALYAAKGQITARAILPPQRIEGGVVHIALVEGKIGAVMLEGATTTDETYIRNTLSLTPGAIVDANELSRSILFFNRTNLAQLRAVLKPGANFGQTDLTLAVQDAPVNDFQIFLDNEGAESTGREEAGIFYHHNGLLGRDDRLTVFGLLSRGGLTGSLSYNVPVDYAGDRLAVSYQRDHISIVQGPNSALDISGSGQTATIGITHPFVADQRWIVTGGVSGSGGTSKTHVPGSLISDSTTYRGILNLSLTYVDDPVIASFAPSFTYARNHDSVLSRDRDLSILTATANVLAQLGGGRNLQLNAAGQYSGDKLLPPDLLFQIGGPSSVRGYAIGAVAGDSGFYADVELHQNLGEKFLNLDIFAFADNGTVFSTQPASRTLSSAGAGFIVKPGPVTVAVSAGFPLRTVLPGQKDPAIYARVSLQL